ncbi:hypothetical protein PV416_33965 [Streptomyces ipomoeae]|uniref:hypothetical protein n=1 Tax=Streptomyces ipomoeae TaxID=103232 RepID=UPI0029AFD3A3|nr:hypothetical protein [Streptomyces ipomoeae]MDX2825945.1 hypothetical protein [Streptomyces ipomoeae]MDX2878610.1 hypothetical protein [Streptomyces ipomoeae]
MTTTAEMRLRHIVEQTALKLTDADGRFHKRQLTDAVREQIAREDLDPHVKAAALDKLAQSLVTGFGEQRNPRRHSRTGRFFHPEYVLKLGNGVWVWMNRATDSDVVQWRRLSRNNRTRVDQADNEIQDYADEVLDAFRAHRDVVYLGDLERMVFGWTEDHTDQGDLFGS